MKQNASKESDGFWRERNSLKGAVIVLIEGKGRRDVVFVVDD